MSQTNGSIIVTPDTFIGQKGIGLGLKELHVPLLELSELVCQRSGPKDTWGRSYLSAAKELTLIILPGFTGRWSLEDPTNLSDDVHQASLVLFKKHWDGLPVRKISVSLEELVRDDTMQLTFFEDALEKALDDIKDRFGNASVMCTVSITGSDQAKELHILKNMKKPHLMSRG